jgi:hypothetical protein
MGTPRLEKRRLLATMTEYQRYFFGTDARPSAAAHSFEPTDNFQAETEDEARMTADMMYRRRRYQLYGVAVWQANRLVFRHSATFGDSQVPMEPALTPREGEIHAR